MSEEPNAKKKIHIQLLPLCYALFCPNLMILLICGCLVQTVESLHNLAREAKLEKDLPVHIEITLSTPQNLPINTDSNSDSESKNIREILNSCKSTFKTKKGGVEENCLEQRRTSLPNLFVKYLGILRLAKKNDNCYVALLRLLFCC